MRRGRWLVWLSCVLLWTVGLLTPYPIQAGRQLLPPQATFPTAKLLHVSAYAFLTILSAWLGVRGGWRWLLLIFLVLHGAATEFLQQWVPERTGSVQDVLLDLGGILLGVALSWKWWFFPSRPITSS